jgi:hypothetical protein
MGTLDQANEAEWSGDDEGYRFFIGDTEITDQTDAQWRDDDLLVWHGDGDCAWVLWDYQANADGQMHGATLVTDSGGPVAWVRGDHQKYRAFQKEGEWDVDQLQASIQGGTLFIYSQTDNQTYVAWQVYQVDEDAYFRLHKLDNQRGPYLVKTGPENLHVVVDGERLTEVGGGPTGDDVVTYLRDYDMHFVFTGVRGAEVGDVFVPALAQEAGVALYRRIGPDKFLLFVQGEQVGKRCRAGKFSDTVLIWDSGNNTWYGVPGATSCEVGTYLNASELGMGQLAWASNGQGVLAFYRGRDVSMKCRLERRGQDASIRCTSLGKEWYVRGFASKCDVTVRILE